MDLIDKINDIASRIPKLLEQVKTEEATKTAFVMPFISALGYDVFNPGEVIPEFTADVGTKKGEKVDYAICKEEKPIMLFECKWCGNDLSKEKITQLYRYFSVVESRFGILTNGLIYRFYSDIEDSNKMDNKPFFEFNIQNFGEKQIDELKKFAKETFDLTNILNTASELKYTKAIKTVLAKEFVNPSEDLIKFFAGRVYQKRITEKAIEKFSSIVKEALGQFMREKINERLKSALNDIQEEAVEDDSVEEDIDENELNDDEKEAINIIKAIAGKLISADRIFPRNTKSYCGVHIDDHRLKVVCRLKFKKSGRSIEIYGEKKENMKLESISEIYKYSEKIQESINKLLPEEKDKENNAL